SFVAQPIASAPGRLRYQWQYMAGPNDRIEAQSVSYLDYGKRLAVSTFANYGAFALALHARARGKSAPTPHIRRLALRLTASLPDARSKVLALASWVRNNIGHVAIPVGLGSALPLAAGAVLTAREGDGENHATLLGALLESIGIVSSAALVNGDNAYHLPRTPTLGILNHMITYVPSLDLFLDPTSAATAPGYLPPQLMGKPVLLIPSGRVAALPSSQHEQISNRIEFDVGNSGRSRFRVVKTAAGALAESYRQAIRATKQSERESFVTRMLADIGQRGDGVFDAGQQDGSGERYQMAFAGISENFTHFPGPTGIATSFNAWGGIAEFAHALAREKQRTQAFVCHGVDSRDETRFTFAPGIDILALPKNLALQGSTLTYRVHYARSGNTVTVRRHLRFSPLAVPCAASDWPALQALLAQVMHDLDSRISVR
ncbi:MAG: hypothetical protein ACI83P_000336, partial [Janthinobacterium sp.]